MSRPQAPVIDQHYDEWLQYQTLQQTRLYVITHNEQLVRLKRIDTLTGRCHYPNTIVTSAKSAENIARRLNQQYATQLYGYKEIT